MLVLAQALGEYGGLATRTRGPSLDAIFDRLSRGELPDYVLLGLGIVVVTYLVARLLDAA